MQALEPQLQLNLEKAYIKMSKPCRCNELKIEGWITIDHWLAKNRISIDHLPEKNVTRCFSLFAFGLNDFMPSLRFEFEKFLMKVASTLSRRRVTYN